MCTYTYSSYAYTYILVYSLQQPRQEKAMTKKLIAARDALAPRSSSIHLAAPRTYVEGAGSGVSSHHRKASPSASCMSPSLLMMSFLLIQPLFALLPYTSRLRRPNWREQVLDEERVSLKWWWLLMMEEVFAAQDGRGPRSSEV